MHIKNSFRLLVNNMTLVYKAMLFRVIVIVLSFTSIYFFCFSQLKVITESAEAVAFFAAIKNTVLNFVGAQTTGAAEIMPAFESFRAVIYDSLPTITGSVIVLFVILFLMQVLLGICNYTLGVVVDGHMSSIQKKHFFHSLLSNLKKSVPFELLYTLCQLLVLIIAFAIGILFIIYTINTLFILSFVIGIWIVIGLYALFLSISARCLPKAVHGEKIKQIFTYASPGKRNFATIFASYVFAIMLSLVFNVVVFFTTVGAGLTVSMPFTYLFFVCMHFVVDYNAQEKKYYLDYDTIVAPADMRGKDGRLNEYK